MQAEVDGCGLAEVPRMAKQSFIEPAQLRAGFDADGDALVWFAVWSADRGLAMAIDITSDEFESCARRRWGDHFAGPSLRGCRRETSRLKGCRQGHGHTANEMK
jgi:hypothetical protein